MFDMLTNLTKAAIGTALLPVAVVIDVVTLPASAEKGGDPFESTEERMKQIGDSLEQALK